MLEEIGQRHAEYIPIKDTDLVVMGRYAVTVEYEEGVSKDGIISSVKELLDSNFGSGKYSLEIIGDHQDERMIDFDLLVDARELLQSGARVQSGQRYVNSNDEAIRHVFEDCRHHDSLPARDRPANWKVFSMNYWGIAAYRKAKKLSQSGF